jgi:YggT family protein
MITSIILMLLSAAVWIIIIQAILSWLVAFRVISPDNPGARQMLAGLDRLLEPLYAPIRRVLPDFGGLDLSPLVVLIGLQIIRQIVVSLSMGG